MFDVEFVDAVSNSLQHADSKCLPNTSRSLWECHIRNDSQIPVGSCVVIGSQIDRSGISTVDLECKCSNVTKTNTNKCRRSIQCANRNNLGMRWECLTRHIVWNHAIG
ncbi:hypothetical protein D3C86_1489280 [compost metagenome]